MYRHAHVHTHACSYACTHNTVQHNATQTYTQRHACTPTHACTHTHTHTHSTYTHSHTRARHIITQLPHTRLFSDWLWKPKIEKILQLCCMYVLGHPRLFENMTITISCQQQQKGWGWGGGREPQLLAAHKQRNADIVPLVVCLMEQTMGCAMPFLTTATPTWQSSLPPTPRSPDTPATDHTHRRCLAKYRWVRSCDAVCVWSCVASYRGEAWQSLIFLWVLMVCTASCRGGIHLLMSDSNSEEHRTMWQCYT